MEQLIITFFLDEGQKGLMFEINYMKWVILLEMHLSSVNS